MRTGLASVFQVFDNGGRTFDRYSVVFPDGDVLAVGPTGNHPQGVCMWLGHVEPEGQEISLAELPPRVLDAAFAEYLAWYTVVTDE